VDVNENNYGENPIIFINMEKLLQYYTENGKASMKDVIM